MQATMTDCSIHKIADAYMESRRLDCASNTVAMDKKGYDALKGMKVELVSELTMHHADRHIARRVADGKSPCTVNKEMGAAKYMLQWAVDRDMCESNPLKNWKPLKDHGVRPPRAFSIKEVRSLIANTEKEFQPLLKLYLCTGLRRCEGLWLEWSEVDLERGVIKLSAERTKTRDGRDVVLGPRIASMLHVLPRVRQYVFTNPGTWKRYDACTPGRKMKEAAEKAGWSDMSGLSPQSCRVTFSTIALEHDVPLAYVDKMIGHSTSLTVRRYFKPQHMREQVAKVEALVLGEEE